MLWATRAAWGPEHATSKARRVDATAALQERADGATTFIARRIFKQVKLNEFGSLCIPCFDTAYVMQWQ